MSDARHPATRRRFLAGSAAVLGATLLSGCDQVGKTPWFRRLLDTDEDANLYVQRLLLSKRRLAPEYTSADLSPMFKANGTLDPPDREYKSLAAAGFKTFHLQVDGLVDRRLRLNLAELRAMPSRTQITRHDCVEGWSCIGQWSGVPLSEVLNRAGLKPQARFVVLYCADTMDEGSGLDSGDSDSEDEDSDTDDNQPSGDAKATKKQAKQSGADRTGKATTQPPKPVANPDDPGARYYESIDLEDAFHPQTILAYDMNGQALPIAHGAPLRLRVERQLGYKMAKYVMRIAVVDKLETVGKGGGGYWEDNGYEWYAGI